MDDTGFTREIKEQPSALRTVTDYYSSDEGCNALKQAVEAISNAGKLVSTGMGTSRHAAFNVSHELVSMVPSCEIWDAGELLHFGMETVRDDTVVLAISQSGESAETRAIVTALTGKNTIVGMVNTVDSAIGNHADITLPLMGGDEASISNKTYTNTLAVLRLIVDGLAGIPLKTTTVNLHDAADYMQKSLAESAGHAARAALFFEGITSLYIIARGRDMSTAEQWSLILKEGACLAGQGLSAGQFRHGPIEMGGPDLALVCLVSEDTKPVLTLSLGEELAAMGSRVLVIGDRKYDTTLEQIIIPTPSPVYFPLSCAPFIELFVHEAAKQRGRTAGIFNYAVKVTDRE